MDNSKLESEIQEMYALYKQSRDVIDQKVYFNLRRCARDSIDQAQNEHDIQQLNKIARNSLIHQKSQKEKQTAHSSPSLVEQIKQFLSPARSMAIAAAISMVAIAIGLVDLRPGVQPPAYATKLISEHPQLVDQLIVNSQEWQYGFASSARPTSNAFRAGELVIDMNVVAYKLNAIPSNVINQRLRTHAPFADINSVIPLQSPADIKLIESELTAYYSTDTAQQDMFRFGQWVQYHFLLSRLAISEQSVSFFSNNYLQYPELLDSVEEQLREMNVFSEQDIDGLQIVPAADMSASELERISNLLLRVRTLLLYG